MTITYHAEGDICGSCGHQHRTIRTAQQCADKHQAALLAGNPGSNAYSDRVVCRCDGAPLEEWEREELDHVISML